MKFESKLSGTKVTEFDITPIFEDQGIWLSEVLSKIKTQKAMDFILDTFRFSKGCNERSNDWIAFLDWDSIMKVSIMEKYPQYEKELIDYFGEGWLKHYIRFNH